MATRTRHLARFLWAGSFVDEVDTREIAESTVDAATAAMPSTSWYGSYSFGFELYSVTEELFTGSESGGEEWIGRDRAEHGTYYYGTSYTAEEVRALHEQDVANRNHYTLLANMESNGWDSVVCTIAGNWKPVEDGVTVLAPESHPYYVAPTEGTLA